MQLLWPEIILLTTALAVLVYDFIKTISSRLVLFWLAVVGLLLSLASLFFSSSPNHLVAMRFFTELYVVDPLAQRGDAVQEGHAARREAQ